MLKRLTAEFLATFILVFCGTGAAVINQEAAGVITHVGVAAVFGLVVMAMIVSFGHFSGAHMNPAVTVALCIAKHLNKRYIAPYIIVQTAGAIAASAVIHLLFPNNASLGSTIPSGSDMQSLILEFLLTFILMLVILGSTYKYDHLLMVPALAIGGTVGLEALFAAPICGASMNPARSLGPALVSSHWTSLWVYIVGPTVGAIAAAYVFAIFKRE